MLCIFCALRLVLRVGVFKSDGSDGRGGGWFCDKHCNNLCIEYKIVDTKEWNGLIYAHKDKQAG